MEKSLHNPAASAENIVEIIKRAIHAPSGDNAQPWKFTLIDSGVQLFNIADRDETLYNANAAPFLRTALS
jgi:nitroreductase